uniref:Homing endonuclease LAGLIDADG domain-containing protein n=1 Tax=Trebouxia lynnae TaxID=1825957 RepID=A0A5J6DU16_9CHLO|nr:hypothetical protein [Trebouxia lynnae]
MNKIGSSETIRKTTFDFYNYKQNTVPHKKHIDTSFLEWFVGFTEGGTPFIVSNQRLFFIINQKESKILYYIRTNLGFGKVSIYHTYSRYIVADKTNVDRLISIFNGNLLLDKSYASFKLWLDALNSSTPLLAQNKDFCFNGNGWLSGFIDAKGCFNGQKIIDKRYTSGFRVGLRFILDQKNEYKVLKKVQLLLQSGSIGISKQVTEKPIQKDKMYRFACTNINGHHKVAEYLKRYPLRTLKKVCFLRWQKVCNYIKNGKYLFSQGKVLDRVENLIKNINYF